MATELVELGLTDAMETAIVLIEWPDRLGTLTPADATTLTFETDPEEPEMRHLTIETLNDRLILRPEAAHD